MLKNFELQGEQNKRKQHILYNRRLIKTQAKAKLTNSQKQKQGLNLSISNFDMKFQLKAKILKAIFTNSQTIQRQIDYRRAFSNSLPKSKLKSKGNYNIVLSTRERPSKDADVHKNNQQNSKSALRYNGTLQIQKILNKKSSLQNNDSFINNSKIFSDAQSESKFRRLTNTNRNLKFKVYKKSQKAQKQNQKKTYNQHLQIMPWLQKNLLQRQIQFF